MRSSCVSPKDFKATAPESKQHPAVYAREFIHVIMKKKKKITESEKICKRDSSPMSRNILATILRSGCDTSVWQTDCFVYPGIACTNRVSSTRESDLVIYTLRNNFFETTVRARARPVEGCLFFFLFRYF